MNRRPRISELLLTSPREGVVILQENDEEDRIYQEGDPTNTGMDGQPADTFVDARTRTAHTAVSCASSWQPPGPAHTGPTAQESP